MRELPFMVILMNIFFVTISHQNKGQSNLWNATNTDLLKPYLLYKYDKYVLPVPKSDTKLSVDVTLDIKHVYVDDFGHAMTVQGILKMEWEDNRLTWDPNDFGNIKSTYLGEHEIWVPNIFLFHSKTVKDLDHFDNVLCLVNASGYAIWKPPTQFVPHCQLDHTYWPFDTQLCLFQISSYMNNGFDMKLTNFEGHNKSTEHYGANVMQLWEIVKTEVFLPETCDVCDSDLIDTMNYEITVKRVASSYIFAVAIPALVTTFLIPSLFWLPIVGSIRFILSSIIIGIISINILYISKCVPFMESSIPRIVILYAVDLLMVGMALLMSRFCLWVSTIKAPLPWMLGCVIQGPVGNFLSLHIQRNNRKLNDGLEQKLIDIQQKPLVKWIDVAMALNRFFSILYILIIFCLGTWFMAGILTFENA